MKSRILVCVFDGDAFVPQFGGGNGGEKYYIRALFCDGVTFPNAAQIPGGWVQAGAFANRHLDWSQINDSNSEAYFRALGQDFQCDLLLRGQDLKTDPSHLYRASDVPLILQQSALATNVRVRAIQVYI